MAGWWSTIPDDSSTTPNPAVARLMATQAEKLYRDPSVFTTACHDEFKTTNLQFQMFNETDYFCN
jgi:hypothetical protein